MSRRDDPPLDDGHDDDLPVDGGDAAAARLAGRLEAERPVPAPWFRGALRRADGPPPRAAAPERLWARVGGFAAGGAALLLVAALSTAGLGPLAS